MYACSGIARLLRQHQRGAATANESSQLSHYQLRHRDDVASNDYSLGTHHLAVPFGNSHIAFRGDIDIHRELYT